jgi:hypothetical protein
MKDSNLVSGLGNFVSNPAEALVINIPEYYMTSAGSHFKSHQPTQPTGATGNQSDFIGKVDHSVSFITIVINIDGFVKSQFYSLNIVHKRLFTISLILGLCIFNTYMQNEAYSISIFGTRVVKAR